MPQLKLQPGDDNVGEDYQSSDFDHLDQDHQLINFERMFVLKNKIPFLLPGQVMNDKQDFSHLQIEAVSSVEHGEGKTTSLGFDMKTVNCGKDLSCTLKG